MKKAVFFAGAMALISSGVQADTIGVYLGGNVWNNEARGTFGESSNQEDFNLSDETQGSFFIALEHPLPLIPNAKISKTTLDTEGTTKLSSNFEFDGTEYLAGTNVDSAFDVSYVDYTLYYELFDNDLFSFDFGITGRNFESDISITGTIGDTSTTASLKADEIVPLLYVSTNIGLPFTGFNVFAQGNFLSVDDHTVYDYEAGVSYELIDNLAVDVNLTLGYKVIKLELEDLDNLYSDMEFKGVFAGAIVHF